jgi:ABC-type nitrate/sulfonate/bicarbonate transport system permease component
MLLLLRWFTDAALAESIAGDLEGERRVRGSLWYWRALLGVVGYAAGHRIAGLVAGRPAPGRNTIGHAVRALRRRPVFALCTIVLFALGIGANTAVFSVVRAVLLRQLPYAEPIA